NGNARSTTTPDIGAYEFTISSCQGTPVAGTVTAPVSVCSGGDITLNLSGYSVATGIEIQWEESIPGMGFFMPITGATGTSLVVNNFTSEMEYRAVVTCAYSGGAADISNIVSVGIRPFNECYCVPTYATGGTTDNIVFVSLENMAHNTT